MISQRYQFYPAILLFAAMIFQLAACHSSSQAAQLDTEAALRATVASYVKALNEEDIKTLEMIYADDFMSYAPIYELTKTELLKELQNGFDKQDNKIRTKIEEINNGIILATIQMEYMIINENQEIIYAENLLQIWKKKQNGWQLSRILFYSADEIPTIEDIEFRN